MSFAGIAFLFALPLVAAPLVLHLLDRRRNVSIDWGAMEFLVAASTQQTSARRLKQWTLLLLRMLAIAALVFALAQPLIPSGWLGASHRTETIFVIDNSMSTGRSDGDQLLMQSMLNRCDRELEKLSPGDRVRVLTTAPYPIWRGNGGSHSAAMRIDPNLTESIAQTIHSITPTQGRSDLLAGLMTAVQADADPTARRRKIVLVTDGQAADWRMDDSDGWSNFRNRLAQPAIETQLQIIQIEGDDVSRDDASSGIASRGNGSRGNVAVDEVIARRSRIGINEPVELTATIRNHNAKSLAAPRTVSWLVDGEPFHDGLVDAIEPGAAQETNWTHSFNVPGVYRITASIAGKNKAGKANTDGVALSVDDLAADDSDSIVIEVVDEIPVLIVEGESRLGDTQQDSFFLRAALGWFGEHPSAGRAVYVPTILSSDRIAATDLRPFHAVLIPNLKVLDRDVLKSLTRFVSDGGGLWVALGPRTDVDEFNMQWFASGSGLSPVALDRIVEESVEEADDEPVEELTDEAVDQSADNMKTRRQPVFINPFGSEHPAVTQLADHQQLDLGDVAIQRRFRFATDESDDQTSVLLALSNGEALVVEQLLGRGRVIVSAIPLRMQWSELVRSQAFVVMVRDWIDYLSQPRATRFNLQPGDPIAFQVARADGTLTGMLTTPQGESIELSADGFGDEVLRTSRTSLPGEYKLETNVAGNAIPFQVARDARESDLLPLSNVEQKQLAELAGIESKVGESTLVSSSPTDPLWPYLLMGLIALISLELVLSGVLARERFGVTAASESSSNSEPDFAIPETKFPATSGSPLRNESTDTLTSPSSSLQSSRHRSKDRQEVAT